MYQIYSFIIKIIVQQVIGTASTVPVRNQYNEDDTMEGGNFYLFIISFFIIHIFVVVVTNIKK